MDQTLLIEDIVSTKNTLTILRQVLNVNQTSLQSFLPILELITELNDILTRSSVEQIETVLQSTESTLIFNELKDTLNELSDAITTTHISTIDSLNEQLSSFVHKFRQCSSNGINNEQTADDIFKKNLLKSHTKTKTKTRLPSECRKDDYETPGVSFIEYNDILAPSSESAMEAEQKAPPVTDSFAHFRFARKPATRIEAKKDKKRAESNSLSPVSDVIHDSSNSRPDQPRLMISYNHASKSICMDIYKNLISDGYQVWIDLEEMHGSTLTAMAQAIEQSDIILYCVTELYSQSRNCQKEAEYAFVQQKIMIPILLQSHYKPKGWLGLLMGASLYIDFTKNDFTQNFAKLKREIDLNATRKDNNKNDVPKLTQSLTKNQPEQNDISSLQSPKTNSTSNVGKSRSCTLF